MISGGGCDEIVYMKNNDSTHRKLMEHLNKYCKVLMWSNMLWLYLTTLATDTWFERCDIIWQGGSTINCLPGLRPTYWSSDAIMQSKQTIQTQTLCDLRKPDSVQYVVSFPWHSSQSTLFLTLCEKRKAICASVSPSTHKVWKRWIEESDCEKAACTSSNSRTSGLAPVVKKTSFPAQEDQKQKLSLSEWFHSAADELAVLRFNQSGSKSPHTEFYPGQG